ncbi:MAG: nuclear transport factor 2 family protein [Mucilaginibacter sp.]|nr:nuclear transport factor 2 family protein [Mucilaginibacter sp.]
MKTTLDIATQLIELLRNHQFVAAYEELFTDDAISIDPLKPDLSPIKGLPTLIAFEKAFLSKAKIESINISEPMISGVYFATRLSMQVTIDSSNVPFEELCVYEVRDGKIISQQFFINR